MPIAESKIDWDADDVLSATDLNRIEGNTFAILRSSEFSGSLPVTADAGATLFAVTVNVPAGTNVVLRRARFARTSTGDLKIKILIDGESATEYFNDSYAFDMVTDHTLYSNTSGVAELKTLIVKKAAVFGEYFIGCGFYLNIEIVDQA
jgi:hypothetical protein